MNYKVTISFESDKPRPYLAALELSEAISNGQETIYTVLEVKTGMKYGVNVEQYEVDNNDDDNPNPDAVWTIAE